MSPVDIVSAVGLPIAILIGLALFVDRRLWPAVQRYIDRVHLSLDRRDEALEKIVGELAGMNRGIEKIGEAQDDMQMSQDAILSVVVKVEEAQDKHAADADGRHKELLAQFSMLTMAVNELRQDRAQEKAQHPVR
jgi:hypothetical protein